MYGAYVCCVQSFPNMLRLDAASRESTQSVSHLPFNCAHLTQIDNCLGCHGRGTHEFITHIFNYHCRQDRLALPCSHTHTYTTRHFIIVGNSWHAENQFNSMSISILIFVISLMRSEHVHTYHMVHKILLM